MKIWFRTLHNLPRFRREAVLIDGQRRRRCVLDWGAIRQSRSATVSASEFADRVGAAARRPASWWQLLKFGIVGGSGYLINLAVFAFLAGSLDVHHIAAAIGAFCVAVTSNFLWNRYWTFGPGDGPGRLPGGALLRRQPCLPRPQPGRARSAARPAAASAS